MTFMECGGSCAETNWPAPMLVLAFGGRGSILTLGVQVLLFPLFKSSLQYECHSNIFNKAFS